MLTLLFDVLLALPHIYLLNNVLQPHPYLHSKHASLADFNQLMDGKIILKAIGLSIPFEINDLDSKIEHICVGMFNVSEQFEELHWLYVNVNVNKDEQGITLFKEGLNYTDYGKEARPIWTNFQKKYKFYPGYFGPINLKSYLNRYMGVENTYELRVYALSSPSRALGEEESLEECGDQIARVSFISKQAFLALVLLGSFLL